MDESDLGSCPVAGFGISSSESSGCTTTILVISLKYEVSSVVNHTRRNLYLQ
jgi:hypothetical protein